MQMVVLSHLKRVGLLDELMRLRLGGPETLLHA